MQGVPPPTLTAQRTLAQGADVAVFLVRESEYNDKDRARTRPEHTRCGKPPGYPVIPNR